MNENTGWFKKGIAHPKKKIEIDLDLLRKRYLEENKSSYDIAKEFNVNQKTISNRLRELGISRDKSSALKISTKNTTTRFIKGQPARIKSFKKGNLPWNKNLKGVQKAWNKGIPISKEQRENHSLFMKQYYQKHPETKELIRQARAKQVLPKKDSLIEVRMQTLLTNIGIEFIKHRTMKEIKHHYQADIFIPEVNLVIECDGEYWHNFPKGREIDKIRTRELIEAGFKVLRLWGNQINHFDEDNLIECLRETVCAYEYNQDVSMFLGAVQYD